METIKTRTNNIIKINGKNISIIGDLVFNLNLKNIKIEVPLEEGKKYIEARNKLIELTKNCSSEDDDRKIREFMNSNKYIRPIVTVYCKNATVTYLNTMVDEINSNYIELMDKVIEATVNRECRQPIDEEKINAIIDLHLGNPSMVNYKERNKEANIVIESSFPNEEEFILIPEYKYSYSRD